MKKRRRFSKCPNCGTQLADAKGLAIYCPNTKKCPVFDGIDNWPKKTNRK